MSTAIVYGVLEYWSNGVMEIHHNRKLKHYLRSFGIKQVMSVVGCSLSVEQ